MSSIKLWVITFLTVERLSILRFWNNILAWDTPWAEEARECKAFCFLLKIKLALLLNYWRHMWSDKVDRLSQVVNWCSVVVFSHCISCNRTSFGRPCRKVKKWAIHFILIFNFGFRQNKRLDFLNVGFNKLFFGPSKSMQVLFHNFLFVQSKLFGQLCQTSRICMILLHFQIFSPKLPTAFFSLRS